MRTWPTFKILRAKCSTVSSQIATNVTPYILIMDNGILVLFDPMFIFIILYNLLTHRNYHNVCNKCSSLYYLSWLSNLKPPISHNDDKLLEARDFQNYTKLTLEPVCVFDVFALITRLVIFEFQCFPNCPST